VSDRHTSTEVVIDLTDSTRLCLALDDNPMESMSPAEKRRLLIRVLCELVAYGEREPATR
jgi:hypothetical protein